MALKPFQCLFFKFIFKQVFLLFQRKMSDDLVAKWNISLPDGKYKIEFEHGTTSGRRVITVNDKVYIYLIFVYTLICSNFIS